MHAHTHHPTGPPRPGRPGRSRCHMTWGVAMVAGLGLALLSPSAVQARTFHCRAGDVACLIASIKQANAQPGPRHEIRLAVGVYTLTAVDNETDGPNGLPSITSQLTIRGAGMEATVIERQVFAAATFRLIHVSPTGTLTLEGLTVQGGSVLENFQQGQFSAWGGGLFNDRGMVTIRDGALIDNFARGNSFPVGGGLVNNGGRVTLVHSSIIGNTAFGAHGGSAGGLRNEGGTMTVLNSTIASNNVPASGIVCFLYQGGGGGLFNSGNGTVTLQNTILARNMTDPVLSGPDCLGSITSLGHNVLGDLTGCDVALQEGTDRTGDPGLSAFIDDGTPGQGHFPLLHDSPAIHAGNDVACPPTDQLGQPRVRVCDIGAIEFQGTAVSSR
jgi:hypothetical protein